MEGGSRYAANRFHIDPRGRPSMARANSTPAAHPSVITRWWSDRRIRTKVLVPAVVGVVAALTVGVLGMVQLDRAAATSQEIYSNNLTRGPGPRGGRGHPQEPRTQRPRHPARRQRPGPAGHAGRVRRAPGHVPSRSTSTSPPGSPPPTRLTWTRSASCFPHTSTRSTPSWARSPRSRTSTAGSRSTTPTSPRSPRRSAASSGRSPTRSRRRPRPAPRPPTPATPPLAPPRSSCSPSGSSPSSRSACSSRAGSPPPSPRSARWPTRWPRAT